jgi:hypothetical protein
LFAKNKDWSNPILKIAKNEQISPIDTVWMVDDLQFSIKDFVKGYIILPSNNILTGLLRFNGSTVIFKDTITQKTKRYGADEIRGFTAQVDTSIDHHVLRVNYSGISVDTFRVLADNFIVSNATGHATPGDRMVHHAKFVKELIYGDKVCFYKSTERKSSGGMMMGGMMMAGVSYSENIFYFKRKNETTYTKIPDGKRAFKKMMSAYIKDAPDLVKSINANELTYDDIDEITRMYNNQN